MANKIETAIKETFVIEFPVHDSRLLTPLNPVSVVSYKREIKNENGEIISSNTIAVAGHRPDVVIAKRINEASLANPEVALRFVEGTPPWLRQQFISYLREND